MGANTHYTYANASQIYLGLGSNISRIPFYNRTKSKSETNKLLLILFLFLFYSLCVIFVLSVVKSFSGNKRLHAHTQHTHTIVQKHSIQFNSKCIEPNETCLRFVCMYVLCLRMLFNAYPRSTEETKKINFDFYSRALINGE